MGIAIAPSGKKTTIMPPNGKAFSLRDISYFLNGIVEPFFIDDSWLFVNKLGAKLDLAFSYECTMNFGFPIYGICLLIPCSELESQFFMPKDIQDKLFDFPKMDSEGNDNEDFQSEDGLMNAVAEKKANDEKTKKARTDYYFRTAYTQLFLKGLSYWEMAKRFIIYDDGDRLLSIEAITITRLKFLSNMMKYFIESEEYEKCKEILNFYIFLENNF